jgi:D-alanyl-lipoteichoic acid acyltransferase DltB (MBOAT superfamily)
MLFASNVFILVFLPAVLLGYQLLARFGRVAMFTWLSLASLFFYGYWNPKYLLLLLGSIGLNFAASRWIVTARSDRGKQVALVVSIVANLALLGWFKYLFPLLGFLHGIGWLQRDFGSVLLPLGISFFTFTQIAYQIDLKQGEAEPQGLLSYVLFVTFFPHLIAGPIIHHSEMMPQFNAQRHTSLRADDMAVGATWFVLGLSKKVLIADTFGPVADLLFAVPQAFGTQATWEGMLCYAVQLYFDFSGYSDMALGLARMFSLTFPFNFNSPYKAQSIIDYWQRFHMTLTRYLNLYLFNPLSMYTTRRRIRQGKKANKRAQRTAGGFTEMIALPMVTTMFLAGLWHGAGLQYMIFGMVHALYLTVNHMWRVFVPEESRWQRLLPAPVAVLLTFLCVVAAQAFFRAQGALSAVYVLGSALGLHGQAGFLPYADKLPTRSRFVLAAPHAWLYLGVVFVIIWAMPNTQEILGQVEEQDRIPSLGMKVLRWRPNLVWYGLMLVLITATLTLLYASTSFLYFQF